MSMEIPLTLTYDDITLCPEMSMVKSRQQVSLKTKISRNYSIDIPVVASPMDTVCDIDMAVAMARLGGAGCLHRFMTISEQSDKVKQIKSRIYTESFENFDYTIPIVAAVGANGDCIERSQELVKNGANIILIDVAHGHHVFVKDTIYKLKTNLPNYVDIIAGNIVTSEAAVDLVNWGADGIRVGIGGGCFTPEMKVGTRTEMKPIADVQIGDVVYTHTGELKEVIHKFEYDRDEEIMVINGIECTKNHEFYVVHKRYADKVTDDNIHEYAQWVMAENLTDEYFLIEL